MADAVPDWESPLMVEDADRSCRDTALRTGQAILDAYDRGVLPIDDARYLAETLRMVLAAITPPSDESRIRGAMAEAQDHPGRIVTR